MLSTQINISSIFGYMFKKNKINNHHEILKLVMLSFQYVTLDIYNRFIEQYVKPIENSIKFTSLYHHSSASTFFIIVFMIFKLKYHVIIRKVKSLTWISIHKEDTILRIIPSLLQYQLWYNPLVDLWCCAKINQTFPYYEFC